MFSGVLSLFQAVIFWQHTAELSSEVRAMVNIDGVTSPIIFYSTSTNAELVSEKNRTLFFNDKRKISTFRSTAQWKTWQALGLGFSHPQ